MTKLAITFPEFETAAAKFGPVVKYNDKNFYVKAGKAGRVEINVNNGTYVVGSYSNYLKEITEAVKNAGFKMVKSASSRTTFEFDSLDRFKDLHAAVISAVPSQTKVSKPKAAKAFAENVTTALAAPEKTDTKKVSKKKVAPKVEKTPEEVEAVKAKNLETIKKVAKKKTVKDKNELPAHRKAAVEGEGVSDFDPQLARAEVDAILADAGVAQYLPKFLQD